MELHANTVKDKNMVSMLISTEGKKSDSVLTTTKQSDYEQSDRSEA